MISISSGMLSAASQISSSSWRTMFSTPPRLMPGDASSSVNTTGTLTWTVACSLMRRKSTWIGRSLTRGRTQRPWAACGWLAADFDHHDRVHEVPGHQLLHQRLFLDVDRDGVLLVAIDHGGHAAFTTQRTGGSLACPVARLGGSVSLSLMVLPFEIRWIMDLPRHASRDDHDAEARALSGKGAKGKAIGSYSTAMVTDRTAVDRAASSAGTAVALPGDMPPRRPLRTDAAIARAGPQPSRERSIAAPTPDAPRRPRRAPCAQAPRSPSCPSGVWRRCRRYRRRNSSASFAVSPSGMVARPPHSA